MSIAHSFFSSNCATLDVGCYVRYWNGTAWIFPSSLAGVADTIFSDGTYCYTIVSGVITEKKRYLYLNICSDIQSDGSGYVSVRVQSQNTSNYATGTLVAVNINVDVSFTITGTGTGSINDTITITSNSSNYGPIGFGPGFGAIENVSSIVITNVTPTSESGYIYEIGSTNIGSC